MQKLNSYLFIYLFLTWFLDVLLVELEFKVFPLTWVDVFPEDPEFRVILKSDQTALLDTVHLQINTVKQQHSKSLSLKLALSLCYSVSFSLPNKLRANLLVWHCQGTKVHRSTWLKHPLLHWLPPSWRARERRVQKRSRDMKLCFHTSKQQQPKGLNSVHSDSIQYSRINDEESMHIAVPHMIKNTGCHMQRTIIYADATTMHERARNWLHAKRMARCA